VQRLVMMSGVGSLGGAGGVGEHAVHSLDHGRQRAAAMWAALGIDSVRTLLALPTAELLSRQARVVEGADTLFDMDTLYYPRVEPPFTPSAPLPALRDGAADGLDLLLGFTGYEMGLWLLWDDALDRRDVAALAVRVPGLDADAAAAAAALYRRLHPDGDGGMHLLGDALFVMPTLWAAGLHAERGGRAWVYRFDWWRDARRRALHASDQLFFFGTHATGGGRMLLGDPAGPADRDARDALAGTAMDALAAFVRTGDPRPGHGPLAAWPAYQAGRRALMSLGGPQGPQVLEDPYADRLPWWTQQLLGPVLAHADG
jgi:para-nitrobenzyl esterase